MRLRIGRATGLVGALLLLAGPVAACGVPSTPVYRFGASPRLPDGDSPAAGPYSYVLYFETEEGIQGVRRYASHPVSASERLKELIAGPSADEQGQGYLGSGVPQNLVWEPAEPNDQADTMRVNLTSLSWTAFGEITCTLNGAQLDQSDNYNFGVILAHTTRTEWHNCGDFDNANLGAPTGQASPGADRYVTTPDSSVPSTPASYPGTTPPAVESPTPPDHPTWNLPSQVPGAPVPTKG